jgi:putative phosphoribosyl transferase
MSSTRTEQLVVPLASGGIELAGTLTVPPEPGGLVLFAHGSGSSRHSPRNREVAGALHRRQLATLLFDLLTEQEERVDKIDASLRFDIDLLAERLVGVTDWMGSHPLAAGLPLGYFGASTGAGAALIAAARRCRLVAAVVSRGGRPDLAGDALGEVRAPTLLIVGDQDTPVLALNRAAALKLGAPRRVAVVPGATHLFEEPGALDQVAELAADWFVTHFRAVLAARAASRQPAGPVAAND